jgi:hypothetical protein
MKSLTPPPSGRHQAANLLFQTLPLASIKPNPHNARDHSPQQIDKLKRSLELFDFVTPLIIDDSNQLLCGHARLEAARQLGYALVPVIRANHLSESEKRAFIIADNRLAELACWNCKSLRRELQFLSDVNIDFDFPGIGFDTPEVDFILESNDEDDDSAADALPRGTDVQAVTKVGDLWDLGEHHLYCGSALEKSSYDILLAGDRAQMVFTDPPYNLPI